MRKMPFYCTFVRHGETVGNVANLMQCSTGGELTERGEAMSRALGRHLSEEKFSQVFSSDLNRAVQTTKIILEELKTNPIDVIYSPLLRERNLYLCPQAYGDWEMKPIDYPPIIKQIAELKLKPEEYHRIRGPSNGETYEETKARAAKFFEDEILQLVDSTSPEDTSNVLVVSHGIFLMCFLDHLLQSPNLYQLDDNFDQERIQSDPSNCSRTRFSISKKHVENNSKRQITFTHYFDVEHLRDFK